MDPSEREGTSRGRATRGRALSEVEGSRLSASARMAADQRKTAKDAVGAARAHSFEGAQL